jgi:hypothetical protein
MGTSMQNTEQLRSPKNARLCRGKCKNKNPFCGNFSLTGRVEEFSRDLDQIRFALLCAISLSSSAEGSGGQPGGGSMYVKLRGKPVLSSSVARSIGPL